MCGLVGLASLNKNSRDAEVRKEVLSELLAVDYVRGDHSTGVALIRRDKDAKADADIRCESVIYKKAMSGPDFIQLDKYGKVLNDMDKAEVVIGHNRAATHGSIIDSNAHPFEFGHIILAHNGTLSGKGGLQEYNLQRRIDSANIAYNMAHMGEKETLEALDGSFTLTWMNLKTQTFNIARNDKRPIAVTFVKNEDTMWWASEDDMLKWILARNGVEYEAILRPKPLIWFQFELSNLRKWKTTPFKEYTYKYEPNEHRFRGGNNEAGPFPGTTTGNESSRGKKLKSPTSQEWCNTWGLELDGRTMMMVKEFRSYKKDEKRGDIHGTIFSNAYSIPCTIMNQWRSYYETIGHGDFIEVTIRAVHLKNDRPVIVANEPRIVTEEEKKKLSNLPAPASNNGQGSAVVIPLDPKALLRGAVQRSIAGSAGEDEHVYTKDGVSGKRMDIIEEDEDVFPVSVTANPGIKAFHQLPALEDGRYWGPNRIVLDKEAFHELVEDGCAGCSSVIDEKAHRSLVWVPMKGTVSEPLCVKCQNDYDLMSTLGLVGVR